MTLDFSHFSSKPSTYETIILETGISFSSIWEQNTEVFSTSERMNLGQKTVWRCKFKPEACKLKGMI